MKLLFVAFLMAWTMECLSCRLVIHLQAEQQAVIKGKTIDDELRIKYQRLKELKAEIEKLEDQKSQEQVDEYGFPMNPEALQGDYVDASDYTDKFLEHGDDEEATVTIDEESVDTDNIGTRDDKPEEEDEGCDGPEYDNYYGEFCPRKHKSKRDATEDFLGGLWKTGEKLLDGNIGGSVTTFLKTVCQPIYHYLIRSDNDPVMKKFTSRFIPETNLQGSSNAIMMHGAAEEGDGSRVWETMHRNAQSWNPRSSWTHILKRPDAEKKAFAKFIPAILAIDKTISKRLKDVSLVVTTLSTSLHDTMVDGMNKGFKTASELLKDLHGDHESLTRAFGDIVEVIQSDISAEMKIVAVGAIVVLIILQSGLGFWQNKTIQLQNGGMDTVVREMAQRIERMEACGAQMKKQLEDMIQERKMDENKLAATIAQVLEQSVSQAVGETNQRTQTQYVRGLGSVRRPMDQRPTVHTAF